MSVTAFVKTCVKEVVRLQTKGFLHRHVTCMPAQTCNHHRCYSTEGSYRPEPSQAKSLLDIGTRRIFSEEHDIFRQSVRRWLQEEVVPHYPKWCEDGQVSREIWEKAGEQGFLCITTPDEMGGVGGDFLLSNIMHEELYYGLVPGMAGFSIHSDIVTNYITHQGTPEQIEAYVPDMAAGRKIGSIAMTEPGAGSDLQGIRTYAKRDGDDWILNGSKVFISNGYMCDVTVVVAVTNRDAKSPAHGISLFIVDKDTPGFVKGRKLNKMGIKAQDTAELFFEDVRLPASAVLGKPHKGFYSLMQELPTERLLIAIGSLAHAESMFELTREYVMDRQAYGRPLAKLQTVQHKLAEMKTEICMGRAFLDQCLVMYVNDNLDAQSVSMIKYWASELENRVAYQCVQLHGGAGYMMEYPICRSYLDARVGPIWGGATEVMTDLIARAIVTEK